MANVKETLADFFTNSTNEFPPTYPKNANGQYIRVDVVNNPDVVNGNVDRFVRVDDPVTNGYKWQKLDTVHISELSDGEKASLKSSQVTNSPSIEVPVKDSNGKNIGFKKQVDIKTATPEELISVLKDDAIQQRLYKDVHGVNYNETRYYDTDRFRVKNPKYGENIKLKFTDGKKDQRSIFDAYKSKRLKFSTSLRPDPTFTEKLKLRPKTNFTVLCRIAFFAKTDLCRAK